VDQPLPARYNVSKGGQVLDQLRGFD
jgi:hypothetical protein